MGRRTTILFGAVIGGAIGYVIGSIVADYVAPEYYTEEELEALGELLDDQNYAPTDEVVYTELAGPTKRKKEEESKVERRDYTRHYTHENKPPIEDLVKQAKKQEDEAVDSLAEDMLLNDEGEYIDPEELYNDIPILDMDDLENVDEDVYLEQRDTDEPYILLEAEWDSMESGFRQAVLHYYPDDDVLTADNGRPVDSIHRTIGDFALDNFGLFCDEGDVVYVANPRLRMEYRVEKHDGSYEDLVLKAPRKSKDEVVVHRNIFDDPPEVGDDESRTKHS